MTCGEKFKVRYDEVAINEYAEWQRNVRELCMRVGERSEPNKRQHKYQQGKRIKMQPDLEMIRIHRIIIVDSSSILHLRKRVHLSYSILSVRISFLGPEPLFVGME